MAKKKKKSEEITKEVEVEEVVIDESQSTKALTLPIDLSIFVRTDGGALVQKHFKSGDVLKVGRDLDTTTYLRLLKRFK